MKTILSAMILAALLLSGGRAHADNVVDIADENFVLDRTHFQGKVVYLDFWASWCRPCRESFSWMNQMHDEYTDDGLVILAINLDHSRSDAERFLVGATPEFRIFYDERADMAKAYDLDGMPSGFLYDRSGKLVMSTSGYKDRDRVALEKKIRALIGAPATGASQ